MTLRVAIISGGSQGIGAGLVAERSWPIAVTGR
jgi:hypothetical protein